MGWFQSREVVTTKALSDLNFSQIRFSAHSCEPLGEIEHVLKPCFNLIPTKTLLVYPREYLVGLVGTEDRTQHIGDLTQSG